MSEKEVSGLQALGLEGCLLLQCNLTCPDRSIDPRQIVVLSESLGGP